MNDVIEVALAGFMHDWGKLLQRGKHPLSSQARRMTEMLCRTYQGRHTHRHVLWTNDVLENHLQWLPAGLDRQRIIRLASQHHRPAQADEHLIAEGDRLASGHDRRPLTESELENFRKVPLAGIFGGLALRGPDPQRAGWYPVRQLCPDETGFPQPGEKPATLEPDYLAVAREMIGQIKSWRPIPAARACDAVTELSEQWLWSTPASTIDVPDVSLHDHSNLVAALAAALYLYHRDENSIEESPVRNRSIAKFLLVGGDLSGIQSYLFDMPQEGRKGIARAYRARSFFLSLITHAATVRILDALGLPSFNRVMDAGGRFVLVVPNTSAARQALHHQNAWMDEWMLDRFGGNLTLNLDWSTTACGNDFMGEAFIRLFRTFHRAVDVAKRRKMAGWIRSDSAWVEARQRLRYIHGPQRREEQLERDAILGRYLPNANYVGLFSEPPPTGLLNQPVDVLGYHLQLFSNQPDLRHVADADDFFAVRLSAGKPSWIRHRPIASYVPRLGPDDVNLLRPHLPASPDDSGDDDAEALKADRPVTFEHMAVLARRPRDDAAEEFRGLPAIACLKADVDRLGMLFSHGFRDNASLGREATLSRQLDAFLKTFLGAKLAATGLDYRYVYTVFAGGDDLLLVGPWTDILDLALDLRRWFAALTLDHPDVTLSAGIALGQSRMPVSLLAEAADANLEAAKSAGRNRIALFREIFTWPQYQQALENGKRLDRMIRNSRSTGAVPLNTGFVYRLLQYEKMAARVNEARASKQPAHGRDPLTPTAVRMEDLRGELTWRSHLQYDLHRNIRSRTKGHATEKTEKDLEWLESLLGIEMKAGSARLLKLSATYALYRNRGG